MHSNEYLPLFLDETQEMLDRLATGLVNLERSPNNKDLVNEVFRDAHTIKGSAGAMGFLQMAEVAHSMESILGKFRENTLAPSAGIFTALLSALDALKALKQEVYTSGKEGNHNLTDVHTTLDAYLASETSNRNLEVVPAVSEPLHASNSPLYKVDITLRKDTPMKGVRAFILLATLREIGTVSECIPSEEELLSDKFEQRFSVVVATERQSEEVLSRLMGDADVEDVSMATHKVVSEVVTTVEKGAVKAETRQHSVRVDVRKLELLMNLVGELVIERNRLANVTGYLERQNKDDNQVQTLLAVSGQLGRITGDLQREIMKVRMVPISQLFSTFPRLVRDLAHGLNKHVDLDLQGTDTELDRTIVEEIRDPLIHLVRNAIDHGVESSEERLRQGKGSSGRILLKASHEDNNVVITVSDDGAGISADAVTRKALKMGLMTKEEIALLSEDDKKRLIMLPGLSTAREVSDVSGRGVGMDIVRSHIEKVGGSIDIKSELGKGTEFIIRLPLTLAIFRALLVQASGQDFAVAIAAVVETRLLNPADLRQLQGQDCLVLREQIVPVVPLYSVLSLPASVKRPSNLVIVSTGASKVGVLVDRLLGEQEIVIKPLGQFFANHKELAGATILGDGRVIPILDVNGLLSLLQRK